MCCEKSYKAFRRRPLVEYLEQGYLVSERHACKVLEVARATHRYEGRQEQWIELRMRMREIAQTRIRYGYRMIRVLLNREGWKVGKDLVYRLNMRDSKAIQSRFFISDRKRLHSVRQRLRHCAFGNSRWNRSQDTNQQGSSDVISVPKPIDCETGRSVRSDNSSCGFTCAF